MGARSSQVTVSTLVSVDGAPKDRDARAARSPRSGQYSVKPADRGHNAFRSGENGRGAACGGGGGAADDAGCTSPPPVALPLRRHLGNGSGQAGATPAADGPVPPAAGRESRRESIHSEHTYDVRAVNDALDALLPVCDSLGPAEQLELLATLTSRYCQPRVSPAAAAAAPPTGADASGKPPPGPQDKRRRRSLSHVPADSGTLLSASGGGGATGLVVSRPTSRESAASRRRKMSAPALPDMLRRSTSTRAIDGFAQWANSRSNVYMYELNPALSAVQKVIHVESLTDMTPLVDPSVPTVLTDANSGWYRKKVTVYAFRSREAIAVTKSWGVCEARAGDWLLVNVVNVEVSALTGQARNAEEESFKFVSSGDINTCSAREFAETYEPVPGMENVYRKTRTLLAKKMNRPFVASSSTGLRKGEAGMFLCQVGGAADGGKTQVEQWIVAADVFGQEYEPATVKKAAVLWSKVRESVRNHAANSFLLQAMLVKSASWEEFDMFFVAGVHPAPLELMLVNLFYTHGLLETLGINRDVFASLAAALNQGYLPSPYHSAAHGADVLQSVNHFLVRSGLNDTFSAVETMAALLAAGAHDIGHPGLNNQFHVAVQSNLATLYNDRSVLENFHASQLFRLLKQPGNDILAFLDPSSRTQLRFIAIEMIMATDLKFHTAFVDDYVTQTDEGEVALDMESVASRLLILKLFVKAADIGHPAKPSALHVRWSELCLLEFKFQAGEERILRLPSTIFVQDTPRAKAESQIGFISFLVRPLFELVSDYVGDTLYLNLIDKNKAMWETVIATGHEPCVSEELTTASPDMTPVSHVCLVTTGDPDLDAITETPTSGPVS